MPSAHNVTQILERIETGDPRATEELLPLVYDELRELAAAQLNREATGQTLQATSLVHEAYLRLAGGNADAKQWDNRRHFFAAAAASMRRILIENARRKQCLRHGGEFNRRELGDIPMVALNRYQELLSLDEALTKLSATNSQAAELIQLRYFAGMTIQEVSSALEISERTAARLWAYARAWLLREMQKNDLDHESS